MLVQFKPDYSGDMMGQQGINMRPIGSHEAQPFLASLKILSDHGFGFTILSDKDAIVAHRMDGMPVEFGIKELICNDYSFIRVKIHNKLLSYQNEQQPTQTVTRKRV